MVVVPRARPLAELDHETFETKTAGDSRKSGAPAVRVSSCQAASIEQSRHAYSGRELIMNAITAAIIDVPVRESAARAKSLIG